MGQKLLKVLFFLLATTTAATNAHALPINPATGLTNFVFTFGGVGSSATFGGDPTLDVTLVSPMSFVVHVEDCCVAGDTWALVVDGLITPWTTITAGDGFGNGGAFVGPAGTYFEALRTVVFGPGTHTIDLTQLTGISGGAFINVSPGQVVQTAPEPGTALLAGAGLAAAVARRRRKRIVA